MMNPTNQMPSVMPTSLNLTSQMTFQGPRQSSVLTYLDIKRITYGLKLIWREDIKVMVQQEMSEQIKVTVIPMKETIERLQNKVELLEKDQADTIQYNKRLNVIRSNGPKAEIETTDAIVMIVAAESGSAVTEDDVDISQRIKINEDDASKSKDVVVRFEIYKAK